MLFLTVTLRPTVYLSGICHVTFQNVPDFYLNLVIVAGFLFFGHTEGYMRDLVFLTRDQTQAVNCVVLTNGPTGNSQHTDWEKIFAHHVSDKELLSPIY